MKISQLESKGFLLPTYATGRTLHIMGGPGGGKSDVARISFKKTLEEHYGEEFGQVIIDMPSIDAVDFRGFCVPTKDSNGNPISFFTRSGLMPTEDYIAKHPRGMVVLEEKNAGDTLTNKAANMVTLERRFGDHKLPEGWWVVCLSNRVSDKSGASKPMMHSINRECVVELEFHMPDYTTYWEKTEMHPYFVAFAKQNAAVFATEVPAEAKPFCTPRSFTSAAEWMNFASSGDIDALPMNDISRSAVAGFIGDGAAATLFAFLKLKDELPSIEAILEDPKTAKVPSRMDAVYMVMQNVIHHSEPDNVDVLWTYMERLPLEIQTSACVALLDKTKGALLNTKALGNWIKNNRALIANTLK